MSRIGILCPRMGPVLKSKLALAGAAAAALFAVVTLTNAASIPGPSSSPTSATDAGPGRSSATGPGSAAQAAPLTDAQTQAAVADWLPGKVSPSAAKVRATTTTATPAVVGSTASRRTSDQPVIPDHPVAIPDQAPFKPGALASGTNPTEATTGSDLTATGPAGVALSDTFTLSSRPASTHTIFLDPRGASITNRQWNTLAGYNTPALNVAAFTHDDTDPAFDADDLTQLQVMWQEVAADYAAFDVNVTLTPPSDLANAIGRSSAGDTTFGTQVMVTSTPDPHGMGGVAWLGGSAAYNSTQPDQLYAQPAFVWGGAGDTGHNAAQAAAHEAGHTWGLTHESGNTTYYTGSPTWAPIMGASYYSAMGQWSKGEFPGARLNGADKKSHQDEVGTIRGILGSAQADNGADGSATVVAAGASAGGAIESDADIDSFAYSGTGGVMVHVAPSATVTDLDTALDVVDTTTGTVLASGFDPALTVATAAGYRGAPGGRDSAFSLRGTPPAHTTRTTVRGAATGPDPARDATAYSSYGSLGTYSLSIASAAAPASGSGGDSFSLDGITALTRTPGVPIKFQVDYNQGALDPSSTLWAWKSSNGVCKFNDPTIENPTLTCPATTTGAVTVTATASPSGAPVQTRTASFALAKTPQPAPTLALSVAGQETASVNVCTGNTGVVLGTVKDQYGRPIFGASLRLSTAGVTSTVKSDINGQVIAKIAAKPAASYALDSLASGVFAAQTTAIERTVNATAAPCFTDPDTAIAIGDDVTAIPGISTPLTATVTTDGVPATGVPVAFSVAYTDATTGAAASRVLGLATTDAHGIATYLLKATTSTPSGPYKATIAKSTITPEPIASATSDLAVAQHPALAFDPSTFNINGVTNFTANGHREDKLITGATSTVAGRLLGTFGAVSAAPAGVDVTLNLGYTDPKSGSAVVKRISGKTDVNGWFRIPVKNPVPTGATAQASILATKSVLFPAVAETPFVDSDDAPAVFEVKPWNLSLVPSATTVPRGAVVTFTSTYSNPWPDASEKTAVAPDVSFTFRSSGGMVSVTPLRTSRGSINIATSGLSVDTWTFTPATSTAYTAVPTSITIQ